MEEDIVQRIAFLLRLKEGTGAEYDKAHSAVWPEMLDLLKRAGISEYSIFRRDELLFLSMRIEDDFDAVWDKIDADPVNIKWQKAMGAYFVPKQEVREGERFPMMQEVFYLP
jgi:L-rhamnose mutarotase